MYAILPEDKCKPKEKATYSCDAYGSNNSQLKDSYPKFREKDKFFSHPAHSSFGRIFSQRISLNKTGEKKLTAVRHGCQG